MINGVTNDPLAAVQTEGARVLFGAFVQASGGHTTEQVVTAASNLLINALRQQCATNVRACSAWDDLSGKIKALLMNHYEASGRRRNVFPHTQTITPETLVHRPKFKGI
jgi:hypothetical protein